MDRYPLPARLVQAIGYDERDGVQFLWENISGPGPVRHIRNALGLMLPEVFEYRKEALLVADELLTNVYEHGGGNPTFIYLLGQTGLAIGTRQSGEFLTEAEIGDLLNSGSLLPDLLDERGRGRALIRAYASEVIVDPRQKALYALFSFGTPLV